MTNEHIQKLLHNYVNVILKCENIIEKRYGLESIPYMNKDKIP